MILPGELFATLWQRLEPHAGDIITGPWEGRGAREFGLLLSMLETAADEFVPAGIESYLAGDDFAHPCDVTDPDRRAFVVMCALDEAVMRIHPAHPSRFAGLSRLSTGMLARMKARRGRFGFYAQNPVIGTVVPKGPLRPNKRSPDRETESGSDLAHQFEHLTVVAQPGKGRTVRFEVPAPRHFLLPPDRIDKVGLAPIAEDPDDLRFHVSSRGDRAYLDTVPGSGDLAARIRATVVSMLDDGAGLILLPELVTPVGAAEELQAVLSRRGASETPALIVAGSGASALSEAAVSRPYNEAVLLSSGGKRIGRQRKMHLFNMGPERMEGCSITPAVGFEGKPHMEDATVGSELVIYDLQGLGRVMLLICEDFQQLTPGGEIAVASRPDWILAPVLDIGQQPGRWTHRRAIELGYRSLSRIVVSCSATLGVRDSKATDLSLASPPPNIGLCFDGLEHDRAHLVSASCASRPVSVVVEWDAAAWPRHNIAL